MTHSNTDLLGYPLPEPLPANKHLHWHELVGHTIKAVIEDPAGGRSVDVLIITETNCFIPIQAQPEDEDTASISTCHRSWGGESVISEWASARELLDAGAINAGEYQALKEAEERRKAEEKARQIKQAEERLARLKGS